MPFPDAMNRAPTKQSVLRGENLSFPKYILQLPVHKKPYPFIVLLGPVYQAAIFQSMDKKVPCGYHILTAIICQLFDLPAPEPFHSLYAVGCFSLIYSFLCQMIKPN